MSADFELPEAPEMYQDEGPYDWIEPEPNTFEESLMTPDDACPDCDGEGRDEEGHLCKACQGKGQAGTDGRHLP